MNIKKIITSIENSYIKNNVSSLKDFYKEGVKNPSLSLILERNFIKSKQNEMVKTYMGYTQFNNKEQKYRELKNNKEIKSEKNLFWKSFRKLYPKTAIIRTILCKNDRIDTHKTNKKADIFEKNFLYHMWKTHERNNSLADNYSILKK